MFEILKSTDHQFYFVLKSRNGKVVLQSETYTTKAKARQTIKAIQLHANGATIVDKTK